MSIVVEELTKRYAGHPVVNSVSLEVADGEFFVLLGSSGSGKSTLLRMVAGLTETDGGRVLLHGRDVTDLPPAQRGIGFVFQSYALFHGMSVAGNVEFALSIRGVPAGQRVRRRDELLEMVGLAGLGGRMPRQLSGGQQQRVALARALAHQPEVLLLDEPFGALDAKVRLELRRTVREVQRELGISTIFVTHDQEEAFELADRLAVLSFGRLLELGPPEELYLRPETEFVATFLGTANLMVGEHTAEGVRLGPVQFPLSTRAEVTDRSRRVQVLFRPEDVALRESNEAAPFPFLGKAVVDQRSFAGSFERLRLRLPPLPGVRSIAPPAPFGSDDLWVEASRTQEQARRFPLQPGDAAWVGVQRVHALVHPGLRFLVLTDGSPEGGPALKLGGDVARLAHAQVTPLAGDQGDQETAEEVRRRPCDLVVLALPAKEPADGLDFASEILRAGQHHLLLVPGGERKAAGVPSRPLVCVAVGEPGKEDVAFSGRLSRHLGAEATILTILPEAERLDRKESGAVMRAERFLERNRRAMARLGVTVTARIRYGDVRHQIIEQIEEGQHDLLVLGVPLPRQGGALSLGGLIGRLIPDLSNIPVLIIRSPEAVGDLK
ncbi:MAG TPA: ATP-binding cassette domain-containing protein [Thermoanaerobaculia bacterium]|jgi:sulfate transport system ATP-binding protein|nr:ATP-binding cassette domain-containing protein [Thermoanaerobaculia bacterium]